MKKTLFAILALLVLCCSLPAAGQEMRQRTIAGKTYYVYTVKSTDTLDSLTSKLGMTRAEILRFNPSASDGLVAGQWLIFPAGEYSGNKLTETQASASAPTSDGGYTTYTVKHNETIFGVAHSFGISPEQLISLNPQASSGLRQGMVLKVPSSEEITTKAAPSEKVAASEDVAGYEKVDASQKVATPEKVAASDAEISIPSEPQVAAFPAEAIATDSIRITVALPLMSDAEKVSKTTNNFNEFYRGFLVGLQSVMAADDASGTQATPVSVTVIDTSLSPLTPEEMKGANIVVVGEEDDDIAQAARMAGDGTLIMNVFNLRNELYLTHPNVLNTNISQNRMYDNALEYILEAFSGFTPVVLNREGSRAEKTGFIDDLRKAVTERGGNILEINYSGKLTEDDLISLPTSGKYLFIPTSGALTDFNSFASTIKKYRDEAAHPDRIAVFGYPDWIAFRGDARNMLGRLHASYYTRFADIEGNPEASRVLDAYMAWYGTAASDGIPNQALLGYDTARYILCSMREAGTTAEMMYKEDCVQGVQSAFRPVKDSGPASGFINDALFIISFNGDGTTKTIVK